MANISFHLNSAIVPLVLGLVVSNCLIADEFDLDPQATYLKTFADPVPAGNLIDFSDMSFSIEEGNLLCIERLGDFSKNRNCPDNRKDLIAVFSASDTILPNNELNRVVDAINAGIDVETLPTFDGGLPTDINEDFLVASADGQKTSVKIYVPAGAQYLFLSARDTRFFDNFDPNRNYGVSFTRIDDLIGDVNCDGNIDLLDVMPFANLILFGGYELKADVNLDDEVNLLDVDPFVELLVAG